MSKLYDQIHDMQVKQKETDNLQNEAIQQILLKLDNIQKKLQTPSYKSNNANLDELVNLLKTKLVSSEKPIGTKDKSQNLNVEETFIPDTDTSGMKITKKKSKKKKVSVDINSSLDALGQLPPAKTK